MFIDAFLGLCSAVSPGVCTEFAMPGYSRQPISFAKPVGGFSRNAVPWTFGSGYSAAMAGRAIYDAPTGGNLLLVLPHYTPRPAPMAGSLDNGDVGDITLIFTAMAQYPDGNAFTGLLAAGSTAGWTFDAAEIIGTYSGANGAPAGASVIPLPGPQFRFVWSSPLTVGPGQLAVNRGVLQLQARAQGVA